MPGPSTELMVRLGVACLGGLAVGIERELSAKDGGARPRFAGVRTFFLLGLIGGLGATLHEAGIPLAGTVVLGGAAALVVAAYALKAHGGEPDATTEVAAVVVLAAGVLAGLGELPLSSGVFAATWLVLVEKGRIHSMVYRIPTPVVEAAARFAVLALVVLPLLPNEAYGPGPGFNPRELWIFVLLFSGVSFAGFIALLALGPERGYGLAGVLGGLVSSTATTLSLSRESRSADPSAGRALALGVIAACTVVYARMFVLAFVLSPALAVATIPYLAPPFVAGIVGSVLLLWSKSPAGQVAAAKNPLRLGPAIQMAIIFQVFLYLVHGARELFGSSGVLASAAVLGLTDVDALTFSMGKYAVDEPRIATAATALAIGILSNTVVKAVLAVTIGRGPFRKAAAAGLLVLAAAGALAIAYLRLGFA